MRFPYWEVHRGTEARLLPLIPITLHGPTSTFDTLALVDSGAEHNVFRIDLAAQLGVPKTAGMPVTLLGIENRPLGCRLVELNIQLNRYRWTTPAIVAAGLGQKAILGQRGFFAFFTVTFRHRTREVVVVRAR